MPATRGICITNIRNPRAFEQKIMAEDIERLKKILGFAFHDTHLLKEALTHRSYAVESRLSYDNQRLEFLGDAVLEIILTDYLYKLYPEADEGVLTKMRSALAQQDAIARLARKLELGSFMYIGRGEAASGGTDRDSTLCDLFEAVLGACYLDVGLDAVRTWILEQVKREFPAPHRMLSGLNPKGTLQEYTQHVLGFAPEYRVLSVTGPEHNPVYEVEVLIGSQHAVGQGGSRRLAEFTAAGALIQQIAENDPAILDFGIKVGK